MKKVNDKHQQSKIGIVEWFRPGQYKEVKQVIKDLKKIGIKSIRTGVSWADWHVKGSPEWYDWLLPELAKELEVLPCFLYTPPSIGIAERTSSPPKNTKDFADFLDVMITRYGEYFTWVELWNEPNNKVEYDYTLDYSWNKFAKMIDMAAYWAKHRGKMTLLGGMSPIDPNWLQYMIDKGVLENIDAVGIHGFPDVFDQQWAGWEENIIAIKEVLSKNNLKKQIWISEAGFSTWQDDEVKQLEEFIQVVNSSADRVYWYRMNDLGGEFPTVGGFHLDEREYFFGMKTQDGNEKLLYKILSRQGVKKISEQQFIRKQYSINDSEKYILITGGAGFIGTNLAARLLESGKRVMIYDNMTRDGVEQNLEWLHERYKDRLIIQIADIREKRVLIECVKNAEQIFHFSAQVAVTTSLINPFHDFEVNIRGTFNLLEAIRNSEHQPPLVFTSTNKVYGDLQDLGLKLNGKRYFPEDEHYMKNGVDENRSLEFHSPYGCSKGTADQYVLDYCRSYGLKTAVFRMSCIYGPHQFGTENQGWVAHFLISILQDKPLVIYGNGKQVRDVLYIDDLVDAFLLAQKNMDKISGEAFNIGGGTENSVSLLEILDLIKLKTEREISVSFEEWRTGDQLYYVSNIEKFRKATGWKPKYNLEVGLEKLTNWLCKERNIGTKKINESSKVIETI